MSIKTLILASSNEHKISEINKIFPNIGYHVISMKEAGCNDDIIEDGDTLEANALIKARYLHKLLSKDVFSEDTGLEIEALDGAPGVITARYAGTHRSAIDNMQKVLTNLKNEINRNAQFRTVICLIMDGKEYLFEGKVRGEIAVEQSGDGGFGYDPIFIPEGFDQTFAVLDESIKNEISHRKRATAKLVDFLQKYN